MDTLRDLVIRNRSTRRFTPETLDLAELRELVGTARLVASARNLQPLRYILSADLETNARIFPALTWPAFGSWTLPVEGERPSGYILLLGDTQIQTTIGIDTGIAAQTILLAAVERGLAGCILGEVERERLSEALQVPERYRIIVVIALGRPAEFPRIGPPQPDGSLPFWRDETGQMHVAKRRLEDVILLEY